MGCCLRKKKRRLIQLMMIGIDGAGKTSFVNYLLRKPSNGLIPTMGFSSHDISNSHRYDVKIFDVGGGKNIRDIWGNYFAFVHGLILVVDSVDVEKLDMVRDLLQETLVNQKVRGKPLLVLINKQDLEGSLDEFEVCKKINLNAVVNENECPTKVESCSLLNKWGKSVSWNPLLDRGYSWLVNHISHKWKELNERVQSESAQQLELEKNLMDERIRRFRRNKNGKGLDLVIGKLPSENEILKTNGIAHDDCENIEDKINNIRSTPDISPDQILDKESAMENLQIDGSQHKKNPEIDARKQSQTPKKKYGRSKSQVFRSNKIGPSQYRLRSG